jgi:small subunit ribosomal protein S17
MSEQNQARRGQEKTGTVVSNKMSKTIVVEVTRLVQHPLYQRSITKRRKFYAHDEEGRARVGDTVRIVEHRRLSALKRWMLADIVRRAVQVGGGVENADTADIKTVKKGAR